MAPKRQQSKSNQSNLFDDAPFEAVLNGTWDPVKLIKIESGQITLHMTDDQQIQSNLSSEIRIKSRKANSSDCNNFLRPGMDISLLFGYRGDDSNRIPSSWVDARIHSIQHESHKSNKCSCKFYLNCYDRNGTLDTETNTLEKDAYAFGIEQIYILQRLPQNSSEVKPYNRWDSAEDCSTISQSRLMFGKFFSDLSWFVNTTSLSKKLSFIIRSVQNKIVYQVRRNDDIVSQTIAENQTLGLEVPEYCTEIVSSSQHDDAVSCFADILHLLDSAPSAKSGASSSSMVEIVAADSQGAMTLFGELKEIFSKSAGVDSFDEATITKAQSLVEELRPLLLQLPKSSREAFNVFDMFITSLAANKPLLAAVATHEQAIVSMNEIRQEALELKAEAEAVYRERAQKRQKMSKRLAKIEQLRRQLAKLEQEHLNDEAEENQMTSKLIHGKQQINAVLTRAIDVKDTLSFLSDANYNNGILIRQELEALLTDAVPLAST